VPPKVSLVPPTSHPFAVILCKASDDSSEPHPLSYYQTMFTDATPGLGTVDDYFIDQSYGAIDLAGTKVLDWTTVPITTAALRPPTLRTADAQACADSATGKLVWESFRTGGLANGVITIWNVSGLDSGAQYDLHEDGITFPFVNAGQSPAFLGADSSTVSFFA